MMSLFPKRLHWEISLNLFNQVQTLAHLTLAVAAVKPHKRRRMKWLKQNKRDLYLRVRDYFGEEYIEEYEPHDEINIYDLEHTDDEDLEFLKKRRISFNFLYSPIASNNDFNCACLHNHEPLL